MAKKPQDPTPLRYIGDGSALDNVPARDLTADEASAYDRDALLASGLYEAAPEKEAA